MQPLLLAFARTCRYKRGTNDHIFISGIARVPCVFTRTHAAQAARFTDLSSLRRPSCRSLPRITPLLVFLESKQLFLNPLHCDANLVCWFFSIDAAYCLNSLEWNFTLKSDNWASLEKKWLSFQSLRMKFILYINFREYEIRNHKIKCKPIFHFFYWHYVTQFFIFLSYIKKKTRLKLVIW